MLYVLSSRNIQAFDTIKYELVFEKENKFDVKKIIPLGHNIGLLGSEESCIYTQDDEYHYAIPQIHLLHYKHPYTFIACE